MMRRCSRTRLSDSKIRGHGSLEVVAEELKKGGGWLVGRRVTIADISNFVYIALRTDGGYLPRQVSECCGVD